MFMRNPSKKFANRVCPKCSANMNPIDISKNGNSEYVVYECSECKGILYTPLKDAPLKK